MALKQIFHLFLFDKSADIKKDLFENRLLIEKGKTYYDSTGYGFPTLISNSVSIKYPKSLPLIFTHRGKKEIGRVININWHDNQLRGDIQIYPEYENFVLEQIKNGFAGLSIGFRSYEKRRKYLTEVYAMDIKHVALVDRPASHASTLMSR